jgi:hypothetical protein
MPKRVFISYRREDTAAAAGRVYDRLSRFLSKPNVFFDVNAIGGGEDFAQRISSEIAKSDATLVIIGDKWLEKSGPDGRPRIFQASDYVRAELRAALSPPLLVLPVLVAGAHMPRPEQLPVTHQSGRTRSAHRRSLSARSPRDCGAHARIAAFERDATGAASRPACRTGRQDARRDSRRGR